MKNKLSNQLKGYLRIRITGYSPERFLNMCKHKEIEIWGLEAKPNNYEMYMSVQGFRKLKPILKKTRTRITILERYGVPFFFHKYRKRKLFFGGVFLCLGIIFLLSKFIWNIDIQGNQTITDQVILEYLSSEKIYHGMKISDVKCEKIATDIRKQFNDIIWVSASLEGCNLIIAVQENTDTFKVNQEENQPADIVASADGTILEIVTRSGVPCIQEGAEVKKGDLLVTGTVPVMNDAGEVVREDYKEADADIFAEVTLSYDDFCETNYQEKEYTKKQYTHGYVNLFGYRLGLGIKKKTTKNYEFSSHETRLKLNQNFYLPISCGVYKSKEYQLKNKKHTEKEKEEILNHNLNWYCKNLEESGIEILEKKIDFKEETDGMRAKGYIKVKQSIGTVRKQSVILQ